MLGGLVVLGAAVVFDLPFIVVSLLWLPVFGLALCCFLSARRGYHPDAGGGARFVMEPRRGLSPANRVARTWVKRGCGSAERLLATCAEDGASALFRLGRQADSAGWAEVMLDIGGTAHRLQATRMDNGNQLWEVRPGAGTPPAPAPPQLSGKDNDLEVLPVAIARLDAEGRIEFCNKVARRLLGAAAKPGACLPDLLEGLGKPMPDRIRETIGGRAEGRSEVARRKAEDADGFLQVTMTRMIAEEGTTIIVVLSDATELKTLEAQFVQSQKMQAVGQLAGGIAHDFNNLLTAINGHCDLLLLRHRQHDTDHSDLIQIRQNANRAAALVRQLLAFSRKQTLRPQVLHLYDSLAELANLLNRLLGEKVELTIENAEDIWPVRVDERQLEQVIVNLVVNARDAMQEGGVVSLRTRKVTLDEPMERDRAIVAPGNYAVIEVADTGSGIPPDKIDKIFEPFFTTKKVGEGTGLGLSTAYGIIKQMEGFIFVDSVVDQGTIFRIYLPAHTEIAATEPPGRQDPVEPPRFRDPTGNGVVLLVEDEAPVRAFAARALQLRGYTVIEADCGEAALDVLEDETLGVDLFVSDVVMPGLDGPSWVRKAYEKRPDASTVFVSGYSEDMVIDGSAAVPRSSYLAKPFTLNDLVERVRDHMERYVHVRPEGEGR